MSVETLGTSLQVLLCCRIFANKCCIYVGWWENGQALSARNLLLFYCPSAGGCEWYGAAHRYRREVSSLVF